MLNEAQTLTALAPLLARLPHFKIRSDEEAKTMAGVQSLLDFFQQHNATKQTVLIAIGGGVICLPQTVS